MSTFGFRPAGESDDDGFSDDDDEFLTSYQPRAEISKSQAPNGAQNGSEQRRSEKRSGLGIRNSLNTRKKHSLGKSALPSDDFRNAASKCDLQAIEKCIERGVAVDEVFSTGWTALMYAASRGNPTVLEYLLDKGANANYHSNQYTVLMAACGNSSASEENVLKCVNCLAEKGVDANAYDRHHMSALIYAAREGKPNIVRRLVELGVNLRKQDTKGYSALHWAASKGHLRVVQVLLELGADVQLKTSDGSLAVDVAYISGHDRLCTMLRGTTNSDSPGVIQGPGGDAPDEGDVPPHNTPQSETETLRKLIGSSSHHSFGNLEVFLSGLEMGAYIPLFQSNQITFPAFLKMTDHDLIQVGINQLGHRKKLLDAIHATHKKNWEASSLASIQYNKQIKCSEAVAMVSNINKHSEYIGSTLGYITDQIKSHPEILRSGQEGNSIDDLMRRSEEGFTIVRNLYAELNELHNHLVQVSGKENFRPPDMIPRRRRHGAGVIRPVIIALSVAALSGFGICVLRKS